MSTKIQTFGPKEVQEGVITQNGVSVVRRYEYYAEAVGTDGRSYFATGRARPTPYVEEQDVPAARRSPRDVAGVGPDRPPSAPAPPDGPRRPEAGR